MSLKEFSKDILNKDIPLFTLKICLFFLSNKNKNITIDEACEMMFIGKQKLRNELNKIKPIENFLSIEKDSDNYTFVILDKKFYLNDGIKKTNKKEILNSEKDLIVNNIFSYWVEVMGKNKKRTILDTTRKNAINKGLINYSEEECKTAILGCSKSKWHMGKDPKNKTLYNTLEIIFRNQDNTDKFIQYADLPTIENQKNNNKVDEKINDDSWLKNRANLISNLKNKTNAVKKNNEKTIKNNQKQLMIENKNNNYNLELLIKKSNKAFNNIIIKK